MAKYNDRWLWPVQLELLRDRLREKDDTLDKKSKQLAGLQVDKKRLETELNEVSDRTSSSDRQLGMLKRKVSMALVFVNQIVLFIFCKVMHLKVLDLLFFCLFCQ